MRNCRLINKSLIVFLLPIMLLLSGFSKFAYYNSINPSVIKTTTLENFFSTTTMPTDILSKLLGTGKNSHANTCENSDSQKDNKFITDAFACISSPYSFTTLKNITVFACAGISSLNDLNVSMNIEYPLKIPFWRLIVFLLLLKLLKPILPRSSSINYFNYYRYRETCALF